MEGKELSAVEAELYDRQIRLWGIESQTRLRAADALLIGVRGLGSEIAKNILLSGINSLTILDDGDVTEAEILQNFLLNSNSKIGNKIAEEVLLKAQALNPLVKITADTETLSSKNLEKYLSSFTIVVATTLAFDTIIQINNICRTNNVKFIYGDTFGMFGFAVSDLGEHQYYEDRIQLASKRKRSADAEKIVKKVQGNISYPAISKVLVLPNTKQDLSGIKKLTRPNNLFVCMLSLIEYRKKHNRVPNIESKEKDIEELKSISKEILELYNFNNINLDDLYELLFGNVPPVCAILGGVIAQEVIKAVSQKEVTIHNVFLFDPVTYNGKELTVGA